MTAASVQYLQVLVYLFHLSFQMFNFVTPLLNNILYFYSHQTFIDISQGIVNTLFTNQARHSPETNIYRLSSVDRVGNRVSDSRGRTSTATVIIIGNKAVGMIIGFACCVLETGF